MGAVLDRYMPPLLGRRRGWILVFQFLLALLLTAMAFSDPPAHAIRIRYISAIGGILFCFP